MLGLDGGHRGVSFIGIADLLQQERKLLPTLLAFVHCIAAVSVSSGE